MTIARKIQTRKQNAAMISTRRAHGAHAGARTPAAPESWEDADQLLACLGELERQLEGLRGQFQQRVSVLQQQWRDASQPLEMERQRLGGQIEQFYRAQRDEVIASGRKSVELLFGRLGTRQSRSLEIQDPAGAQHWLMAHGFERYLRTRREIDREALRAALAAGAASQESLALSACPAIRLRETEQFWYEVNQAGGRAMALTGKARSPANPLKQRVQEAPVAGNCGEAAAAKQSHGAAVQHAT